MRQSFILLCTLFMASCGMMPTPPAPANKACDGDFYTMDTPGERTTSQAMREKCFALEFEHIRSRKQAILDIDKNNTATPLTGLALSGGGVKSTSFQLGMLAGLHKARITTNKAGAQAGSSQQGQPVLHYLDYISSVSGGTWASATYWAWLDDEDELFKCLDGAVNGYNNIAVACRYVSDILIPSKQGTFLNRESWRKQRAELLLGDDFKLAQWRYPIPGYDDTSRYDIKACNTIQQEALRMQCFKDKVRYDRYQSLKRKPYPIFNASHSIDITTEGKSSRNFPFQITPDFIGTVVDCNSLTNETIKGQRICSDKRFLLPAHINGKPRKGFFLRLHKTLSDNGEKEIRLLLNDYSEVERNIDDVINFNPDDLYYIYNHEYPATSQTRDFYVSHAMASSGGLIAALISTNLEIIARQHSVSDNVREKYILADGGKSDNLGILPLIERNTRLIISSQIAGDPDIELVDLRVAILQANRLYDVDLTDRCGISPFEACLKDYIHNVRIKLSEKNMFIQEYTGRDAKRHTLILIKPTAGNSSYFRETLRTRYASVFAELDAYENRLGKDKWRFPQSPTLTPTYKREIMYAYYLLGKHIAMNGLSEEVSAWLRQNYP